jgi:hypothetical protein
VCLVCRRYWRHAARKGDTPVIGTGLGLTPNQLHYAAVIVLQVQTMKLPTRAAHIALECALTESGLRMYANGHQPASLKLPHDAVGWDHGSVGLFQQQVGGAPNSTANWGTVAELMNAATSAGKFLHALTALPWKGPNTTNWHTCQQIQGSSFADASNYRRQDARAILIGNALWTARLGPFVASGPPHIAGGGH